MRIGAAAGAACLAMLAMAALPPSAGAQSRPAAKKASAPASTPAAPAKVDYAQRFAAVCASCHGANGRSDMAGVPVLAGQPSLYAITQLFLYREGRRNNEAMTAVGKTLTDDDMRGFADYIGTLPPVPAPPAADVDAARMAKGKALSEQHKCVFCHGAALDGGQQVPRIAGQKEDYLRASLRGFKGGTRPAYTQAMISAVSQVPVEDLDTLAYYAEQRARFVDVQGPAAGHALRKWLALDVVVHDAGATVLSDRLHAGGEARVHDLARQPGHGEKAMQAARVASRLATQQLQAVLTFALADDVRDGQATFTQLAQHAVTRKLGAGLELFVPADAGQPDVGDLGAHVGTGGQQHVTQGFDRVVLDTVPGEGAGEAGFGGGAAHPLRVESQDILAEGDELIELVQPLELRPKEVRFDHQKISVSVLAPARQVAGHLDIGGGNHIPGC
jgi:cytochrome c553